MLDCQSAFPCAPDLFFLNIDLLEDAAVEGTLAFRLLPITTTGDMPQQEAKGAPENAAALNGAIQRIWL